MYKHFFFILFLIVGAVSLGTFSAGFLVWLCFALNYFSLIFILYYHLYLEKVFSPFLSTYIVFNYIFFVAAPIAQINHMLELDNPIYLNNYPYKENFICYTALLILFMNITFFLFYDYFKKRSLPQILRIRKTEPLKNLPTAIAVMAIVGGLFIIVNWDFIIYEFNRPAWMPPDYNRPIALMKNKVLFIFPLGILLTCKAYFSLKGKNINNLYIVIGITAVTFLMLIMVKNPLITKRHDLGPILFLLIFMTVPKLINSNVKFISIIYLAIVVGLPIAQLITHIDYGFDEILADPSLLRDQVDKGVLTNGYVSLNYDAFMNSAVVLEIVSEKGLSYGFQLLGAILFFVPRSVWPDKPISSGKIVGEQLTKYDFHFDNLSNPYFAEGFYNFGVFGVFIFGILLGWFCVVMLKWLNSSDWLKKGVAMYFALHLVLLLRGDFNNGVAYFTATFIGIYVLPKMFLSLFQNIKNKSGSNKVELNLK